MVRKLGFAVLMLTLSATSLAETVRVAVSSNFRPALEAIGRQFQPESGYSIEIVSAATGTLVNQISHGAPYDIIFAADETSIAVLNSRHKIDPTSVKTYAYGELVAYSEVIDPLTEASLRSARSFVIANPTTAPYGKAAYEALSYLANDEAEIIHVGSVSQAYQVASLKHVQIGIVASSLVSMDARIWKIPPAYYRPLTQQLALTSYCRNCEGARALAEYILSPAGQSLLEDFNYRSAEVLND